MIQPRHLRITARYMPLRLRLSLNQRKRKRTSRTRRRPWQWTRTLFVSTHVARALTQLCRWTATPRR